MLALQSPHGETGSGAALVYLTARHSPGREDPCCVRVRSRIRRREVKDCILLMSERRSGLVGNAYTGL